MIEFQEFNAENTEDAWDSKLFKFGDYGFQQTYSFGELGKSKVSNVFRALLVEGDRTLVMAQGHIYNSLFGPYVLVIRGGPVYQSSVN